MIHVLKTWPEPFSEIVAGTKTFEYRRNDDRHFRQGDLLILREWDPVVKDYTGSEATARVGFVICGYDGTSFGVPKDYAVLSITRVWVGQVTDGWATMPIPLGHDMADQDVTTPVNVVRLREFSQEGGARP